MLSVFVASNANGEITHIVNWANVNYIEQTHKGALIYFNNKKTLLLTSDDVQKMMKQLNPISTERCNA